MNTCGVCSCGSTDTEADRLVRLEETIGQYQSVPGGLIPVLQIAQGIYGHLPDPALHRICAGLGKSYSEVAGVVGFYSFFSTQPRGRHTIRVCLGTACYVRGAKRVLEAFKQHLGIEVGQTTPNLQFTLEVARCLGACGIAPACLVGSDVHQSIKTTQIASILQPYE
jgi:NADH:ubiquinone oxidoreductase subunit E